MFQSDTEEPDGEYYTKLQGDGNLVTRSVDASLRGTSSVVWAANPFGNPNGDYFLALDCGEETVSIYRGTPSSPHGTIWTSPVGPLVPFDASALDFSGYVESEPNVHSGDCFGGPVDAMWSNDSTCAQRANQWCVIGWTQPGEQLHYKFRAAFPETVMIRLRAASGYDARKFSAWIDGVGGSGKDFVIRQNGGWDTFEDYSWDVDLPAGQHTLKVYFNDGDVNLCSVTVMTK